MVKKLLIVDDQKDIVFILERELCRRPDIQVLSAFSLPEALALLEEKEIDFVISDVRLGPDSGFVLAKQVRDHHPGVGVILISAYRSPANRQTAESLGVYLFVEKPFVISKMVSDVQVFFDRPPVVEKNPMLADTIPLEGMTSHFKAQDLVQLFCLNGRAIMVEVTSVSPHQTGHIYIQRGQVQHADLGELTGDTAFYAIMQIQGGRLTVKDWDQPVAQTITSSWEHLLIYSAIEMDHGKSGLPILPLSQAG